MKIAQFRWYCFRTLQKGKEGTHVEDMEVEGRIDQSAGGSGNELPGFFIVT